MKKPGKALITGGAGFIGSHLCDDLLEKGFEVVCLDNLITGKEANIKKHFNNPNFTFIKHDISEPFEWKGKLEFILHFASPASPVDYLTHPIQTLKVGSFGAFHALELARVKQASFLLASTSEVYGDPKISPQPEKYWGNVNPIGPRSVYDEAKRFSEALTMAYYRTYGLDTRIVRLFNTYGPRMRQNDGRVTPNFICQALRGKPLTVYGDGQHTRSLCYVSDTVNGIYKLMLSDLHDPVNIGNPHEKTILDLAKIIIRLTKSKSKVKYDPLPVDDPKKRKPAIEKAKKLLGWEPKVNLRDGLTETIQWFSNYEI